MPSLPFEEAKARVGTLSIGALLAVAGGFLDGFTYVGHGRVFANAMTGNVVLLGVYLFSGDWRTALRHLPPIIAFLLGVSVAQAMQFHSKRTGAGAPYVPVLVLEIWVLLILSLLPQATPDFLFTISIAFAASIQVQTFREVHGRVYSSTFTTGNLRTLSEAAFFYLFEDSRASLRVLKDFSAICAAFLLGAAAGGLATRNLGNRALSFDIVLLILVAIQVRRRLRIGGDGDRRFVGAAQ